MYQVYGIEQPRPHVLSTARVTLNRSEASTQSDVSGLNSEPSAHFLKLYLCRCLLQVRVPDGHMRAAMKNTQDVAVGTAMGSMYAQLRRSPQCLKGWADCH